MKRYCAAVIAVVLAIVVSVGFAPPEMAIRSVANLFGNRIKNLGEPVDANDAVTKSFATNAANLAAGVIPTSVSPTLTFGASGTINSGSGASGVSVTPVSTGVYTLTRSTAGSANVPVIATAYTADVTAISLDGANDYIATPVTAALGNAYSYCCWIKFTAAQTGILISKRTGSGGYYLSSVFIAGDAGGNTGGTKLGVQHNSVAGNRQFISPQSYNDNEWHHVAVTHSSSQTNLYVDGASVALSTSVTSALTATDTVFIGVSGNGSSIAGNHYNGSIRDVRLWHNTTLTSEQIAAVISGQSVGSPTISYPLSTGIGTAATDSSGNGNTGTLTNGPTWATVAGSPLLSRVTAQTTTATTIEFTTTSGVKRNPSTACVWLGR